VSSFKSKSQSVWLCCSVVVAVLRVLGLPFSGLGGAADQGGGHVDRFVENFGHDVAATIHNRRRTDHITTVRSNVNPFASVFGPVFKKSLIILSVSGSWCERLKW
jgi:hypothetical protein